MIDPTLTISIDRTALSLTPLVLSGTPGAGVLAVHRYTEPAIVHNIVYAPDSAYIHGSLPLAARLEQTLLQFDVRANNAVSEAEARTAMAELRLALNQFAYDVTVTTNGVAEVWACDPGSVGTSERDYVNLRLFYSVFPISIPCHPVRS